MNISLKNDLIKKSNKSINKSILIGFVTSFCILLAELIYNKFNPIVVNIMDIIYIAIWVWFTIETILRLIAIKTTSDTRFARDFQISEGIYLVASVICIPLSIINPELEQLRWILLLKMPNACSRFNDEKVFTFIGRIIAIILICAFIIPFLNVISIAISPPNKIINILPQGFDSFSMKYVLQDKGFYRSILISIFITAVGTFLSVTCMAMAAYPLSKKNFPLRAPITVFFIIIMLFSGGMAPNILLMNVLHLTNTVWVLILPGIINVFHLILLKGFFEGIPEEFEESAKIDGAKNYTILFKIILPIAAPMIATVAFFTAVSYWNNINRAILFITSNTDIYPLPMYIKNFLSRNPNDIALSSPELLPYWDNIKMSYIFLSIVPMAIVYPFIFKYIKNDVAAGGVKG